ncbi:30S ribosomal protein S6e [Euryarchaeota archaeon]|jgi:small subunit ribosomal protein S6e|nr:30S ribosomal protein S6e [Euryarchaeota archaeon]MBT4392172.1 30S ribosomal protein S6e [Euryarchaeota archaeon]MBT4802442.1 30S ribosomal protein S6e [Euryarchaeota archaeon]MBT5613811.1 30S ribosomal protein S6e [Euryarchaeota archaeon]MBT6683888.1 30S ribosomal protein S6e [Euryarchaeota archaeon]|tara:strand:- start:25656 stop:26150 length:495 start_codon:yes stop_codon:yes gene_type:complete
MAGEQSFKAVINDTNPTFNGRAFSMEITGSNYNHLLGKKIGDTVDGGFLGEGDQNLTGYKLQITGGSDVTGRPMRSDLDGGSVKSILITAGVGYKGKKYVKKNGKVYRYKHDGLRRRRNLRGNVISPETRQINLKVVEVGKRNLGIIFGVEEAPSVEQASTEEA